MSRHKVFPSYRINNTRSWFQYLTKLTTRRGLPPQKITAATPLCSREAGWLSSGRSSGSQSRKSGSVPTRAPFSGVVCQWSGDADSLSQRIPAGRHAGRSKTCLHGQGVKNSRRRAQRGEEDEIRDGEPTQRGFRRLSIGPQIPGAFESFGSSVADRWRWRGSRYAVPHAPLRPSGLSLRPLEIEFMVNGDQPETRRRFV